MEVQLVIPEWLKLSQEVRNRLVEIFEIPKSKGSQMESQGETSVLISDGYTHEDLAHITVEKMKVFLDDAEDTDFISLFHKVLAKIAEENTVPAPSPQDVTAVLMDKWLIMLGQMQRDAIANNLQPQLLELIGKVFNVSQGQTQRLPAKKRGRPAKAKQTGTSGSAETAPSGEGSPVPDISEERQVS